MTITVANKRTHPKGDPTAAYVGRPSALGNPFAIGRDGTREEVIARYEDWLTGSLALSESRQRHAYDKLLARAQAGDLTLICWCHPLPCHADVIKRMLEADAEFTPEEREWVIDAAIATQALAGITVPREVAEAAFDEAMKGPMPQIGEEDR